MGHIFIPNFPQKSYIGWASLTFPHSYYFRPIKNNSRLEIQPLLESGLAFNFFMAWEKLKFRYLKLNIESIVHIGKHSFYPRTSYTWKISVPYDIL